MHEYFTVCCTNHSAKHNSEDSCTVDYRSRVNRGDDNGARHYVCEVTFRINQFESRIADDFGGGQQMGS